MATTIQPFKVPRPLDVSLVPPPLVRPSQPRATDFMEGMEPLDVSLVRPSLVGPLDPSMEQPGEFNIANNMAPNALVQAASQLSANDTKLSDNFELTGDHGGAPSLNRTLDSFYIQQPKDDSGFSGRQRAELAGSITSSALSTVANLHDVNKQAAVEMSNIERAYARNSEVQRFAAARQEQAHVRGMIANIRAINQQLGSVASGQQTQQGTFFGDLG